MLLFILLFVYVTYTASFTKVLVPASYKEFDGGLPYWVTDNATLSKYNYTVIVYQKRDPSQPHYLAKNRGCENGIIYKYIVDYYDNLPDVTIFTHADPGHHGTYNWLEGYAGCVSPNATFMSINLKKKICRSSWNGYWAKYGIWLEQCMRDVLKIIWDLKGTCSLFQYLAHLLYYYDFIHHIYIDDNNGIREEFHRRVPPSNPIHMCLHCCQQFVISRDMIRRRPLSVWRELLEVLGHNDVCHAGEPDYENLYSFNASSRMKLGPEKPDIPGKDRDGKGYGLWTQALVSEHLAHMIFGHFDLVMPWPTMDEICYNYLPDSICPGSPCSPGKEVDKHVFSQSNSHSHPRDSAKINNGMK